MPLEQWQQQEPRPHFGTSPWPGCDDRSRAAREHNSCSLRPRCLLWTVNAARARNRSTSAAAPTTALRPFAPNSPAAPIKNTAKLPTIQPTPCCSKTWRTKPRWHACHGGPRRQHEAEALASSTHARARERRRHQDQCPVTTVDETFDVKTGSYSVADNTSEHRRQIHLH
eukprot:6506105-Alexandrium_andersonii.AAC.1